MRAGDDRRTRRTRTALVDAFNHLVLNRRQPRIRVSDIIAQADVGRSTFYEHYSNADALLLEALSRPFAILADAAAGRGDPERLAFLLTHFWENRRRARETLAGQVGDKARRLLADMVEARLDGQALAVPLRLASLQLAEAALAPIKAWVAGEAPCSAQTLAASLCRTGERLVEALAIETGTVIAARAQGPAGTY